MFVRSRFSPWNTDIALGVAEKKCIASTFPVVQSFKPACSSAVIWIWTIHNRKSKSLLRELTRSPCSSRSSKDGPSPAELALKELTEMKNYRGVSPSMAALDSVWIRFPVFEIISQLSSAITEPCECRLRH